MIRDSEGISDHSDDSSSGFTLRFILWGTEVRTERIIKEPSLDGSPRYCFVSSRSLDWTKPRNARETDRTANVGSHCKVRSPRDIPSESRWNHNDIILCGIPVWCDNHMPFLTIALQIWAFQMLTILLCLLHTPHKYHSKNIEEYEQYYTKYYTICKKDFTIF